MVTQQMRLRLQTETSAHWALIRSTLYIAMSPILCPYSTFSRLELYFSVKGFVPVDEGCFISPVNPKPNTCHSENSEYWRADLDKP